MLVLLNRPDSETVTVPPLVLVNVFAITICALPVDEDAVEFVQVFVVAIALASPVAAVSVVRPTCVPFTAVAPPVPKAITCHGDVSVPTQTPVPDPAPC